MYINYKKGGVGHVLVKTDKTHEDATGKAGLNGKEIISDTMFTPEKRARTYGTVIQLPVAMGSIPISQISKGYPGYGPIRMADQFDAAPGAALYSKSMNSNFKFMSDISPDVRVGDKIYFKWRVLNNPNNLIAVSKGEGAKSFIYRVSYDQIFCVVRPEGIWMIGGHILIDPLMETWQDEYMKTYYDLKDAFGMPIEKPKDQWIKVKITPQHVDRRGVVAAIGTPLKGTSLSVSIGESIMYKPRIKNLIEIEGKKYIVLRQDQILCGVDE